MLVFVIRRLGAAAVLLFLVLTATFFFIHLAPGEPGRLFEDPRISHEQRQAMRQRWGLDQPLVRQYGLWMAAAVRGDWGTSLSTGRPVAATLRDKMVNTCVLALGVVAVEYGLGIALGIAAAARAGRLRDRVIRALATLLFAVPVFWLAVLCIELFTVRFQLFPTNQMSSEDARLLPPLARALDVLHHLALPALILGLARSGGVIRFVRNSLLDTLARDFIRTARAKGLSPLRVLWVHALGNSLLPLVQRFGVALPMLLNGTLIIEVIFAWPGLGLTTYNAILQRDYPLIMATTALSAALVVLGSLAADLLHAWLDPRVRHV